MISSFDYYKQIENPIMYLCNPDRRYICALNSENRHLLLRFNDLSELSFTVPRFSGVENTYDLVESKRLLFVEKIGWFQIDNVSETIKGNECVKEVTAKSHQYSFKNRGFVTEGRMYMFYNPYDPLDEKYDSGNIAAMPSVIGQLCKQLDVHVELSSSDIEPTEDKGDWTIIYIDPILKFKARSYGSMYESAENCENVCRSFEANDELNGYDFIINKAETAFEVIFEFDYLHHTIKIKTLEAITQPTDIYLSFENIVNSVSIKENAEDIVTVMSCNGGDLDIRTVNSMGTNYIVDFSYYKKNMSADGAVDYPWMSRELILALDEWEEVFKSQQDKYAGLVLRIQDEYVEKSELEGVLQFANLKLKDLQVARDQYINKEDKVLEGGGFITAETVKIGDKSFKCGTIFHAIQFSGSAVITGHVDQPSFTKGEDGIYKFDFSDPGEKGTANSLIQQYNEETKNKEGSVVPLYFMDGDNRSYCKLNVSSIIEVAKDENGNTAVFRHTQGESWSAKNGIISIDGVEFTIKKESSLDSYIIAIGEWSQKFASNVYFVHKDIRYKVTAGADGIVSLYKFFVSGFDRFTTYKETAGSGGWCDIWEKYINKSIVPAIATIDGKISSVGKELEKINKLCNVQQFIKNKDIDANAGGKESKLYDEFFHYWIEGEYTNDNISVQDSTTMAERIKLAKELMAAGVIDLSKNAQPKFEMSVDAINFIKIYEFRQFTNELALGRTITIEKTEGVYYHLALMSLEYDLDSVESFTMTFSNTSKPGDTSMTFADLIKESSNITRNIEANWSNITDYSRNKEQISRLIQSPLDRTLRAMQKNLASQAFVIDEDGILGRKYDLETDATKTTFLKEQIRIINNTIAFTTDNWETAALALGKIQMSDGSEAYGLVADVLIGELILGERISIGSKSERVRIDDGGILIKNDNNDAVFEADVNGNITLTGTVHATDGTFSGKITADRGEIGGYVIGENSLIGNNVGMRSKSQNARAAGVAFWAGAKTETASPFYVTDGGELHSTAGVIGGFTINGTAIYNGRDTLLHAATDGVYLGKDGISLGYDKDAGEPKIYASADGKFRASNATILGEATLSECVVEGNLSTQTASAKTISASEIITDKIEFIDTSHLIKAGDIGGATVKANLTISNKGIITVTCRDISGNLYALKNARSFSINWVGSNGVFGSGSGSITITIDVGSYSSSKMVSKSYVSYTAVFGRGSSTTTQFTDVSDESGFIFNGSVIPDANNKYTLGSSNFKWKDIFSGNSGTTNSDENVKHDIKSLDQRYDELFDSLVPITFVYNDNTSGRSHMGLSAQNLKNSIIEAGLTTKDCAAYVEWKTDDGRIECGIRYSELIALNIYEIQRLKRKIADLEISLTKTNCGEYKLRS